MPAQKGGNARSGCLGVIIIVIVIAIIAAIAGGGGSSSSPQKEAREYIQKQSHNINIGRVDYEHVKAIVAIASKSGNENSEAINELAKVAQEAHNEIDSFRQELFRTEGNKQLSEATFQLSEGANELKNAMGALVAYTGSPNPATLAHFTTQLEAAKGRWNHGVEEIWRIANEPGAMTLK